MDGSFACPECGGTIEIQGLSPGRHVRCGFCNRLVEIPFIPRVVDPSWRRPRFRRSRWVLITWCGIAMCFVGLVTVGFFHLAQHRSRLERHQAIERLIDSATEHRKSGAFRLALIDLDSAIELLKSVDSGEARARLAELKLSRAEIARQDSEKTLAELTAKGSGESSIGAWLTLRSRVSKDPDLAALKAKLDPQFKEYLEHLIVAEYARASSELESKGFEQSLGTCLRVVRHAKLLPPDLAELWNKRLEGLVTKIVQGPGIVLDLRVGESVEASNRKAYASSLVTTTLKALREKGYQPAPSGTPWETLWGQAPFRLNCEITERREGNYQGSQNRLTRIVISLVLTAGDRQFWETTTASRSRVPLPRIPASYANQLAISPARIDELEQLLYEDAASMVNDRLSDALKELPTYASFLAKIRSPG